MGIKRFGDYDKTQAYGDFQPLPKGGYVVRILGATVHENSNGHKELYEAVWKKAYMHDDRNIMAHVHRMRKKMGDDRKDPQYIQNVYGIGYMVEGI